MNAHAGAPEARGQPSTRAEAEGQQRISGGSLLGVLLADRGVFQRYMNTGSVLSAPPHHPQVGDGMEALVGLRSCYSQGLVQCRDTKSARLRETLRLLSRCVRRTHLIPQRQRVAARGKCLLWKRIGGSVPRALPRTGLEFQTRRGEAGVCP